MERNGARIHATKLEILDYMRHGLPVERKPIAEKINRYPDTVDKALDALCAEGLIASVDTEAMMKIIPQQTKIPEDAKYIAITPKGAEHYKKQIK